MYIYICIYIHIYVCMYVYTPHIIMMNKIKSTLNSPQDAAHVRMVFNLPQYTKLTNKVYSCITTINGDTNTLVVTTKILTPKQGT